MRCLRAKFICTRGYCGGVDFGFYIFVGVGFGPALMLTLVSTALNCDMPWVSSYKDHVNGYMQCVILMIHIGFSGFTWTGLRNKSDYVTQK